MNINVYLDITEDTHLTAVAFFVPCASSNLMSVYETGLKQDCDGFACFQNQCWLYDNFDTVSFCRQIYSLGILLFQDTKAQDEEILSSKKCDNLF